MNEKGLLKTSSELIISSPCKCSSLLSLFFVSKKAKKYRSSRREALKGSHIHGLSSRTPVLDTKLCFLDKKQDSNGMSIHKGKKSIVLNWPLVLRLIYTILLYFPNIRPNVTLILLICTGFFFEVSIWVFISN